MCFICIVLIDSYNLASNFCISDVALESPGKTGEIWFHWYTVLQLNPYACVFYYVCVNPRQCIYSHFCLTYYIYSVIVLQLHFYKSHYLYLFIFVHHSPCDLCFPVTLAGGERSEPLASNPIIRRLYGNIPREGPIRLQARNRTDMWYVILSALINIWTLTCDTPWP